jgi:PAS domain S-box-containing protein
MGKRILIFLMGVSAAAVLFAVDILLPHMLHDAIPYFAPVLLAWWSPKRLDVWLLAGLCGILIILGYFIVSSDPGVMSGEASRIVMLIAIMAVAGLIYHAKGVTEQLRQSGELFRSHYKDDPVPIYTWRRKGDDFVLVDYNDAAFEITSGAVADYMGLSAREFSGERPETLEYLERAWKTKIILRRTDDRTVFPPGQSRNLDIIYVFVPPDSVMVHTVDITERVQAENALRDANEQLEKRVLARTEELGRLNSDLQTEITGREEAEGILRESEERYRTLVEQSPEGVIVHDGDQILFANEAALALFGASSLDEMLATHPNDLVRDEDRAEILERRRQVLDEGQVFVAVENVLERLDGVQFVADRFVANVQWNGRPAIQLIIRDITRRKQADMALREAKEAAEQANSSKSRFLAAASHDLRQPIQALNLFVHSLGRKTEGNKDIEDLLNALLDISKLDAGMVDPEIEDFPIEAALDDVSNSFSGQAREKGVDFRVVTSSAIVASDPTLVRRIIYNYVSNAVRYTETGRILLGCRNDGNRLRIEVWDTGPGIPENEQAQIFEEFYQLENPARDRSRGLGLGLAIVKRTAGLLGLEIGLKSIPGKGSVFWVSTPLSSESTVTPLEDSPANAVGFNHGTIVLIEDDAIVLRGLEDMLSGAGYDVVPAETTKDAATYLSTRSMTPDLIIADHRLGAEQTGIEAIGLLQARFGGHIPAIIITGDTAPDRLREASDGGHVLLHKPVLPELLLSTVARVMQQQGSLVLSD